jgi:hypothetical protein
MKSLYQATAETVASSHQAVQNSLTHLSHCLPITTQVWRVVRSAYRCFHYRYQYRCILANSVAEPKKISFGSGSMELQIRSSAPAPVPAPDIFIRYRQVR